MPGVCRSRDLKVAWHLQRVAPDILPAEEPLEGFDSILQGSDPMLRFQLRELLAPGKLPRVRSGAVAPLFQGPIALVALDFGASSGGPSLSDPDVAVAGTFVSKALGPIAAYASQYGPTAPAWMGPARQYPVAAAGARYNDAQLRAWVNTLVAPGAPAAGAAALVVLNPPGALNTDADATQGVLGYHGLATVPYGFVNVTAAGLDLNDRADRFALALSHEIAELVVDPRADLSNPEVCDPCGPNCQTVFRDYFDDPGGFIASSTSFPPSQPYAFYINGIVRPPSATACPAPDSACAYAPPSGDRAPGGRWVIRSKNARRSFSICSGVGSAMCVAIPHSCPYGSTTRAYRSPQNMSIGGMTPFAPALTARS